jgi:hypothetical protein
MLDARRLGCGFDGTLCDVFCIGQFVFKRIHSLICSVAYPVLEAAGEMPTVEVAE